MHALGKHSNFHFKYEETTVHGDKIPKHKGVGQRDSNSILQEKISMYLVLKYLKPITVGFQMRHKKPHE